MSEYQFTKDWFQWAPGVWKQLIPHLPDRKSFLEIGSFEGMSAVWTVENMMEDGGEIFCVDTWEGGAEHVNGEMDGAERRYAENMRVVTEKYNNKRKVTSMKYPSTIALPLLTIDKYKFDFIYIDGSHLAKDVLTDACMAWPLLKRNGFMVFDDYAWKPSGFTTMQRPKIAIDAFVNMFEDELVVSFTGYQLIVRKIK
jgi:predicted O-methyltransferase YrrM